MEKNSWKMKKHKGELTRGGGRAEKHSWKVKKVGLRMKKQIWNRKMMVGMKECRFGPEEWRTGLTLLWHYKESIALPHKTIDLFS